MRTLPSSTVGSCVCCSLWSAWDVQPAGALHRPRCKGSSAAGTSSWLCPLIASSLRPPPLSDPPVATSTTPTSMHLQGRLCCRRSSSWAPAAAPRALPAARLPLRPRCLPTASLA